MPVTTGGKPVLEPAAPSFAEQTANPPFNLQLPPAEGRKALDEFQSGDIAKPARAARWALTRDVYPAGRHSSRPQPRTWW